MLKDDLPILDLLAQNSKDNMWLTVHNAVVFLRSVLYLSYKLSQSQFISSPGSFSAPLFVNVSIRVFVVAEASKTQPQNV